MKSSEVSIKTRSTPASLTIQGQVTKDTTEKWPIVFIITDLGLLHYKDKAFTFSSNMPLDEQEKMNHTAT